MQVNPFWFGVFVTVFAELVSLFAYALYEASRRGKK